MEELAVPAGRSIFGVDPMDDFAVLIADCIWDHCQNLSHVEIEAKVGILIDRNTNARLQLPVFTETVVDAKQLGLRFESNMSMDQHRRFNQLLNHLVAYSANQAPSERVTYKHQKEVDYFYDERMPDTGSVVHLRVTRDAQTLQIKPGGVVTKKRVADINVYAPNRPFDYRISINTETPMPPPPEDSRPTFIREKDRLSYAHQNFNVDLTQVILPNNVRFMTDIQPQEPVHELEVEIRDSVELMQHAFVARGQEQKEFQEWTPFEDTVLILLNNVRLLIRYVRIRT